VRDRARHRCEQRVLEGAHGFGSSRSASEVKPVRSANSSVTWRRSASVQRRPACVLRRIADRTGTPHRRRSRTPEQGVIDRGLLVMSNPWEPMLLQFVAHRQSAGGARVHATLGMDRPAPAE
jgi:hypothetical protein